MGYFVADMSLIERTPSSITEHICLLISRLPSHESFPLSLGRSFISEAVLNPQLPVAMRYRELQEAPNHNHLLTAMFESETVRHTAKRS